MQAQHDSRILIYANKSDFLVPFIKKSLEEMTDNKTDLKLFSLATNLNLLIVNTDADKLLRNTINYNFPDRYFRNFPNSGLKDSIFNIFIQNDRFLLINENILQDKIEFQLTLYEIIQGKPSSANENDFPLKNIIKPIAENNFFIDVSSPEYLTVLKNGVKKLLPESNSITTFKTSFNGNCTVVGRNTIFAATGDTINLRIAEILDNDTEVDKIDFRLNFYGSEKITEHPYSFIKLNKYNFRMAFSSPGTYTFSITADDGVTATSQDSVTVYVSNVPKIMPLTNRINVYSTRTLAEVVGYDNNFISFKFPVYTYGKDSILNFKI